MALEISQDTQLLCQVSAQSVDHNFRPWNIFSDYDTWAGFPVFAFFKDELEARKSLKAFFYSQNYN